MVALEGEKHPGARGMRAAARRPHGVCVRACACVRVCACVCVESSVEQVIRPRSLSSIESLRCKTLIRNTRELGAGRDAGGKEGPLLPPLPLVAKLLLIPRAPVPGTPSQTPSQGDSLATLPGTRVHDSPGKRQKPEASDLEGWPQESYLYCCELSFL